MPSKYDIYWQSKIDRIAQLLKEAYKYGKSSELDVSDLQNYGRRNSWYGIVEIYKNGLRKGEMSHIKSLGKIILSNNILRSYGRSEFRIRITKNLKLMVERLDIKSKSTFAQSVKRRDITVLHVEAKNVNTEKTRLVEILREIPWRAWKRIVKEEPEWRSLSPLLNRYGFGPFAVLMIITGLNAYQLKGKAEEVYWPKIYRLLAPSPTPKSPGELYNLLKPFYQKERLNTIKVRRLRHFLNSPLAYRLWNSTPQEVSAKFLEIWRELTKTMGQRPIDKTICFAMKCLGISLLMVGEYDFDFSAIPIPVDSRVRKFTQKTRICLGKTDREIRKAWSEVLSLLRKYIPNITMIHLDSLIWQIAPMGYSQLQKYFENLNIPEVGYKLSTFLQTNPTENLVKYKVRSTIKTKNRDKALILIPCCKRKRVIPVKGSISQPLPNIQPLRDKLLNLIRQTPHLAEKQKNKRGILDPNAQITQAIDLYAGNFYRIARNSLYSILAGRYPSVHVLIVSAFYGLVKLDEGLKEYELQMGDTLYNGMKVYQFWRHNQLWKILKDYIIQNNITYVWSLLPDSMPRFPYHQVFNSLWRELRSTRVQCFHVKVPSAGRSTGSGRAKWLVEILRTNPNYLIGKPLPLNRIRGIPEYEFHYTPC